MAEKFRLLNLPYPPSTHDQYMPIRMGNVARVVPTGQLKKFQKDCERYFMDNFLVVGKARQACREWMLKGNMLQVDFYFFAHGTRLWTQHDAPRKYDTSNLVKPVEDELAKLLQVDDSCFFRGSHEKAETMRSDPFVNIMLRPWKPRSFQEIKEQEGF